MEFLHMNKAQACSSQISNTLFRPDAIEVSAEVCSPAKYLVELWHVFLRRYWRVSPGVLNVFGVAAAACWLQLELGNLNSTNQRVCSCDVLALCMGDFVTRNTTQQRDKLIVVVCSCRELYDPHLPSTETGMERTLFGGKSMRRSASPVQTLMSRCDPSNIKQSCPTGRSDRRHRRATLHVSNEARMTRYLMHQQRPVWTRHKSLSQIKHLWHLSHSFSLILYFGLSFSQRNMTWTRVRC